jgi:protein ImuB
MIACLHVPGAALLVEHQQALFELAGEFSPEIEQSAADAISFCITPLRAILGSWLEIGSEIARRAHARRLRGQLAIAADPDTAIILAHEVSAFTLVAPGDEAQRLADIPLTRLIAHDPRLDPAMFQVLHQWGLKTCADLGALPEDALSERLGVAGVYLRHLALGQRKRPLRICLPQTNYAEAMDLEHPLEQLEPLLFLLNQALGALCERMRSQAQAARLLEASFALEGKGDYVCRLEFPVALENAPSLLKLLQLHLERHSPGAPIKSFRLRMETTGPRRAQGGLFLPPMPQPDKLQVTLARIAGLVGEENVGTPELINSYRPDGFRLTALNLRPPQPGPDDPRRGFLRLSLRLFRPPLAATVRVVGRMPAQVMAAGVKGHIIRRSGPWESSGEWWAGSAWHQEEWDVGLDDGALYRLACELPRINWLVVGVYD